MNTETVYTKDLKRGDLVLYYGATFEVVEDAVNRGQQVERLAPYTVENNARDIWAAKCKHIGGAKDYILKNYDVFQSNSTEKCWSKIVS